MHYSCPGAMDVRSGAQPKHRSAVRVVFVVWFLIGLDPLGHLIVKFCQLFGFGPGPPTSKALQKYRRARQVRRWAVAASI